MLLLFRARAGAASQPRRPHRAPKPAVQAEAVDYGALLRKIEQARDAQREAEIAEQRAQTREALVEAMLLRARAAEDERLILMTLEEIEMTMIAATLL